MHFRSGNIADRSWCRRSRNVCTRFHCAGHTVGRCNHARILLGSDAEVRGSRREENRSSLLLVRSLGSARSRCEGGMWDVEGCVPGNFNDGVRAVGPSDVD